MVSIHDLAWLAILCRPIGRCEGFECGQKLCGICKMERLVVLAAAGALWAVAFPGSYAHADTVAFDITGMGTATTEVIPTTNGITGITTGATALAIAANGSEALSVTGASSYQIQWYQVGQSAADNNYLSLNGTQYSKNMTAGSLLATTNSLASYAFVDLTQMNTGGGNIAYAYLTPSVSSTGVVTYALSTTPTAWVLLGYNDNGSSDWDYNDDMVVAHVTAAMTATPLPGALPLMGSALGFGGLMSSWTKRRRRRSAPAEV